MAKRILQNTSLKANIISNFAGNGWSALINILFVPVYLNYIGSEGYGLIGIFTSLQLILSLLDSGLATTLNREISRLSVLAHSEQRMNNIVKTLETVYWLLALAAGIVSIGLSPLLAKYWVQPQELSVQTITYAFFLLSATLVFQFPSGFYSGGLLGLQRQVILNLIRITFVTLKNVGGIFVLLFVSKSVLAFFGWTLLVAILQAFTLKFYLWYYLPKAPSSPRYEKQELKNTWRFATGLVSISLTAILLTSVDKIILSKILSLEQFGYYTIACSLGLLILQVVSPLTQSYFPRFSILLSLNKIEELKNIYHQACQMISVLVLPATLLLIFFSKELIFIWTRDPFTTENTWLITAIYAYGTGLNGLMNIPFKLTITYGWTKLGYHQNTFFLIIMIPLTLFLALKYGAVGGAISWAIINTLYFISTPLLIHNKLLKGEAGNWYWKDTLKPLLAALAIIGLGKYLLSVSDLSIGVELMLIILTGLVSVIGSIFFANKLKNNIYVVIKK